MSSSLGYLGLKAALTLTQRPRLEALLRSAKAPDETQLRVLRRILTSNASTTFGTQHGFSKINTIAEYRRAVPVQDYEDIRELVERQELTGEPCLTAERPVFFNRTSGTVTAAKNIPVTESGLKRLRDRQRLGTYVWSVGAPILSGKVFAVGGSAVEGHMQGGTPYGSASGKLHKNQPRLLQGRYVLPHEMTSLADYQVRYLAMAILGVSEPEVTCVATANPSTLTQLLSLINQHAEMVLEAVATGRVPDEVSAGAGEVGCRLNLQPRRTRAVSLQQRLDANGELTYADCWPNLAGVVTWTGGSCGVALSSLRPTLPSRCLVIEVGWVASEMQGTINVDARNNTCLPLLEDTFFEFVERDASVARRIETGAQDTEMLTLGELETGRDYNVVVTTSDGLYRYDMSDIVRVTGWLNATPTLEFVQKASGITSITGEKLYETQVLGAVSPALLEHQLPSSFFIMLADVETARYTLYVEPVPTSDNAGDAPAVADLARDIDKRLCSGNIEYDAKRASGRLESLRILRLRPGTGAAYRLQQVAAGQRDMQFKYLHVQYSHDCLFDFDAHVEHP